MSDSQGPAPTRFTSVPANSTQNGRGSLESLAPDAEQTSAAAQGILAHDGASDAPASVARWSSTSTTSSRSESQASDDLITNRRGLRRSRAQPLRAVALDGAGASDARLRRATFPQTARSPSPTPRARSPCPAPLE